MEKQAVYYNAKRQQKEYAVGDMVLLSTKNIKTKRPSKKLDFKFYGPFRIEAVVGKQAYRLEL